MITPEEAIKQVSYLNQHLWIRDKSPQYGKTGAYVFKKPINDVRAYIKLKIEEDEIGDILLVISFHEDY